MSEPLWQQVRELESRAEHHSEMVNHFRRNQDHYVQMIGRLERQLHDIQQSGTVPQWFPSYEEAVFQEGQLTPFHLNGQVAWGTLVSFTVQHSTWRGVVYKAQEEDWLQVEGVLVFNTSRREDGEVIICNIRFWKVEEAVPVLHPHNSNMGLCIGEVPARNAVVTDKNQVLDYVRQIVEALKTVNNDSLYSEPEVFDKFYTPVRSGWEIANDRWSTGDPERVRRLEARMRAADDDEDGEVECAICHMLYNTEDEGTTCESCSDRVCDECSRYSDDQGRTLCERCFDEQHIWCDQCNCHRDEENIYTCDKCLETVCTDCAQYSQDKEDYYCSHCFNESHEHCGLCYEDRHIDYMRACDECDEITCVDCIHTTIWEDGNTKGLCDTCYDNMKRCETCGVGIVNGNLCGSCAEEAQQEQEVEETAS